MARRRDKAREGRIAEERVPRLLELAEAAARAGRWDRAHRYADLAWRISLRHQLGAGVATRGRVCRRCRSFLVPGATARVRLREGRVVRTCLVCGAVRRRVTRDAAAARPAAPEPGKR